MKKQRTITHQVDAIVSDLFGRCYDCGRTIWPWQQQGIDGQSHRGCHRERCRRLLSEMPHMRQEILVEIDAIEAVYR